MAWAVRARDMNVNSRRSSTKDTDEAAKLFLKLQEEIDKDADVKPVLEDHEKEDGDSGGHLQQPPTAIRTYYNDELWVGGRGKYLNKKTEEVVEALRFKTLKGGYNLLMYAAYKGRGTSFGSLVKSVKHWLGRRGLVKQLRESDIHMAPLLFQAASSSSLDCFTRVRDEIRNTLGRHELRQQLLAKDLKRKTITFHAACSQNVAIFKEVCEMLRKENEEKPGSESWLITIPNMKPEIDRKRRTILHHACLLGSAATVSVIIEEAGKLGNMRDEFLGEPDFPGETAVMNVLRSTKVDEVEDKLEMILGCMSANEKVRAMTEPTKPFFSTALSNAVYSGFEQLEIARKNIFDLVEISQKNTEGDVDLDAALGLRMGSSEDCRFAAYGSMLAEAAYGGKADMLKHVVTMIQIGVVKKGWKGDGILLPGKREIRSTIEAFTNNLNERGTLFTMAIASRDKETLSYVKELIERVFEDEPDEIWYQLCGCKTSYNNLTLATLASASLGDGGEFFEVVYKYIDEAANNVDKTIEGSAKEKMSNLFVPKPDEKNKPADTPLVQSMSSNDVALFRKVCEKFELIIGRDMTLTEIGNLIPEKFNFGDHGTYRNPNVFKVNIGDISKKMLIELFKELSKSRRSEDRIVQREKELELSRRLAIIIRTAAERGAFHVFRALASSDLAVYLGTIPLLLERIGDYEENITDAMMLTASCARNPFVTSAIISRYIQKAEVGFPMHRDALRRLQEKIDTLIQEVLNVLPNTVKGVGEAFATHANAIVHLKITLDAQKDHDRMATKLGYSIMRMILEPYTVPRSENKTTEAGKRVEDIGKTDPLQHALNRGSKALDFINSPLVLDYLAIKFSRSTPSWSSVNPFDNNATERYYRHSQTDPYAVPIWQEDDVTNPFAVPIRRETATKLDELMRFLQGWENGDEIGVQRSEYPTLPHVTLLPGLQFLLAGIIGKPSAFYEVPAVRFTYELLSYIVMVILFTLSMSIEDPHRMTNTEVVFYIFVLGMIWREAMEFRQAIPERLFLPDPNPGMPFKTPAHYFVSAVRRYLFKDAWNILDTSTIILATAAFIFRIIAIYEDPEVQASNESFSNENTSIPETTQLRTSAFVAQVLLASTAPLLFARILSLSQIDSTLGPMTQIIWTMLSHLAQFSVFILVLISSFALTFHVLLKDCGENEYASLISAHLAMFKAMLGEFEFDDILGSGECNYSLLKEEAARILLAIFLVIVAILLMNLLIAVLSTVHAEVYRNAEKEFHLARAKIIQQSWRSWFEGRQPPPLNLIMPLAGFLGDLIYDVIGMITDLKIDPFSKWKQWKTFIAAIHRTLFALTMGPAAGVIFLALWTISVPWVAWCILRNLSSNKVKDKLQTQFDKGYVRRLCAVLIISVCWTMALVPALLLSIGYVILAFPLWLFGFFGITQWWVERVKEIESSNLESPEKIIYDLNSYPGDENRDENGDLSVKDLVKMTSGLELDEFPRVIKSRDLAC